ncbi:MAG: sugar kinase [Deltaproteobacteria bacterium]|nr:sugar kinase [Deltaproteobacteria bacterium]
MLAIVGTVPDRDFPLVQGEAELVGGSVSIQGYSVPVNRGTPALIASAIKTAHVKGDNKVFAWLAGDIGLGDGSRRLYKTLTDTIMRYDFDVITFHYLLPDSDWHARVIFAVQEMKKKPVLIADAGFMYAAKMSGQANEYDLFTPDAGELAFLADEEAPHPFYTRGFILHDDKNAPALIKRAYTHNNASRYLIVKGEKDHVADEKGIIGTIDAPAEEAMEAIGGTGDTLTGIVSALIDSGMGIPDAAILAAKVNRVAGHLVKPDPSTQIMSIIEQIPEGLRLLTSSL